MPEVTNLRWADGFEVNDRTLRTWWNAENDKNENSEKSDFGSTGHYSNNTVKGEKLMGAAPEEIDIIEERLDGSRNL